MLKKVLAAAVLVFLIGLLVVNITNKANNNKAGNDIDVTGDTNVKGAAIYSPTNSGLEVGQMAPNFKLKTLSGKTVQLSDLQGKKVFLNFWATWCPPCKKEMPEMQKFYEKHADEVEIVAVNVTGQEKGIETVRDFIGKTNYTFPILLDTKLNVSDTYSAITIPTTYFIGTDGVLQQPRKVGPMTHDFMNKMLEKLD